mgnify:FL=1
MNVLVIESPYESTDEMEALYRTFTDAEVDVDHASEIDIEEVREDYDTVLSELVLENGVRGPDVLDQFEADRKALYTVWRRDEADDYPEIQEALDQYTVIHKPRNHMDLEKVIQEELSPHWERE